MRNTKCTQFQAALAREAELHTWTGLSSLCGIARTNLNSYATGRSRPSVDALRALAAGLPPEEGAPLILAHLIDECPADVRPYLTLELRADLLATMQAEPEIPDTDLDALFAALRQLAEKRQDIRHWLALSYELMR